MGKVTRGMINYLMTGLELLNDDVDLHKTKRMDGSKDWGKPENE